MPRLHRLSEIARKTLETHPCVVNDTAPWTRLSKSLAEARVALVTTAGIHVRGDRPFTPGEQTFRIIPASTPARDIVQSHTSIGFDRSDIQRDLNVAFPVDRLRELVEQGELGSLADTFYSFMGAQRTYDGLIDDAAPEVAHRLKADGVDVVLMNGT